MRTGKHTLAMMGQAYLERLQGVQVQTTGSDVMRDREAVGKIVVCPNGDRSS